MKQVEVIKDADILIPNKTHENFTATDEIIPRGEKLKGIEKLIEGKRRGKPYTYKLFITDNDEIIYNNQNFRVEAVNDYSLNGYVEYHVVRDYE